MAPVQHRVTEAIKDTGFVDGISEYCDGWCDRCRVTSHCAHYAQEKSNGSDTEALDACNRDFWNRIEDYLICARECIREPARQRGIDLDQTVYAAIPSVNEAKDRHNENAVRHQCSTDAKGYAKTADDWFRINTTEFATKLSKVSPQKSHTLADEDADADAFWINDAVEVIRWYQHQIYVKIVRALTSTFRSKQAHGMGPENDFRGSAKVALTGIDRSVAAWVALCFSFPGKADSILDILVLLDRLRTDIEGAFPEARRFVRPGLD